jgi:hypothetical protein
VPDSPLVTAAKQIEELSQEILDLAKNTDLIAKTFVRVIQVVRTNVVKRAYNAEDKKKKESKK